MARIPFVDTHYHLHDMRHPELRYSWLEPQAIHTSPSGDIGAIKSQGYRIDGFLSEARFANLIKTVHVQAALGTDDPVGTIEPRGCDAPEVGASDSE